MRIDGKAMSATLRVRDFSLETLGVEGAGGRFSCDAGLNRRSDLLSLISALEPSRIAIRWAPRVPPSAAPTSSAAQQGLQQTGESLCARSARTISFAGC